MAGEAKATIDHDEIRKWAEVRGGKPGTVKRTESDGEAGLLRIDFPGYSDAGSLEEMSWDEFFQKFDEKNLAFLYQDETSSGEKSCFFKLISRDTAEYKAYSSSAHSKTTHKTDEDDEKHESKAHAKSEHKDESKSHSKKAENKAHKSESKSHK